MNSGVVDHWLVEVFDGGAGLLSSPIEFLYRAKELAKKLKLTVVSEHIHYFGPGLSAILVIAESHISFHTWPETGYVYCDVASCSKRLSRQEVGEAFSEMFGTARLRIGRVDSSAWKM
jgi:S-adenosylmethionine decarboxylase